MTLDRIWVFGEAGIEGVATITLEMLAKAREVAGTVEVFLGGDGAACAAELGDHGAARVYATGDLSGRMQGVSVASAVAAAIAGGGVPAPDAFMLGTTYDGRDVAARLSVKLDASVLSNVVDLRLDGDRLVGVEPVFGGTLNVTSRFTDGGPDIWLVRPEVLRALAGGRSAGGGGRPSRARAGRGREVRRSGTASAEESQGPKLDEAAVVVSGGRGLGSAEAYSMIEQLGQAARRRAGGQPGHRRRGLGALQLSGRPDRQGGQAHRLHRLRHLGRYPAPGGHEGLQEHHRHQQGL